MKKLLLIALILTGCCKCLTPNQKIALRISQVYKDMGMTDSAAYYKELSKIIR